VYGGRGVFLHAFLTLRTDCCKWVTIHLDSFTGVVEALFIVRKECGGQERTDTGSVRLGIRTVRCGEFSQKHDYEYTAKIGRAHV
jgi:hypothetical protein